MTDFSIHQGNFAIFRTSDIYGTKCGFLQLPSLKVNKNQYLKYFKQWKMFLSFWFVPDVYQQLIQILNLSQRPKLPKLRKVSWILRIIFMLIRMRLSTLMWTWILHFMKIFLDFMTRFFSLTDSVADPGCLFQIPDQIFPSRIQGWQGPGSG